MEKLENIIEKLSIILMSTLGFCLVMGFSYEGLRWEMLKYLMSGLLILAMILFCIFLTLIIILLIAGAFHD